MQLLYGLGILTKDTIDSPVYTLTDQDYQRDVPSIEAINRELSRTLDINGTPVFTPGTNFDEIFYNKTDHKLTKQILSEKLGVKENSVFITPFFDGIGLYAIAMTRYTQIEKALGRKSPDLLVTASNQENSRFNLTFSNDKTTLTGILKLEVNFVRFIENNPPHIELTVKITVRSTAPEITRETFVKCNFSKNKMLLDSMKPLEVFQKTEKKFHKKDIDNSIRECISQSIINESAFEIKEKKTNTPREDKRLFTRNQLLHYLQQFEKDSLNPKSNKSSFDLEKFRHNFLNLFKILTNAHSQETLSKKKFLDEFREIIRSIMQIDYSHDNSHELSTLSQRLKDIEETSKKYEEIFSQLHRFLSENLPDIIEKLKTKPSSAALSSTTQTVLSDVKFGPSLESKTPSESTDSDPIAEKISVAQRLCMKYQLILFEKRQTQTGEQPATVEYVFTKFNPLQQARLPLQIPLLDITLFDRKLQQSLESLLLLPSTLMQFVSEYVYEGGADTIEDLQSLYKQHPQIFPNLDHPLKPQQIEFYNLISTVFTALLNIAEGHHLDTSSLAGNSFSILQSQIFNQKGFNAFQKLSLMDGLLDRSQQFGFQRFLDDLCILLDHVLIEISNTHALALLNILGIKNTKPAAVTTDQVEHALNTIGVHYAYIDQRQGHWVVFMWPTEAYKAAFLISIEKCRKSLQPPSIEALEKLNQLKLHVFSGTLTTVSKSQLPNSPPFIQLQKELQTQLKSSIPAPGPYNFQFLNQDIFAPNDSKKKSPPQQPSQTKSTLFHHSELETAWLIVNSFKTAALLRYQKNKTSTPKKELEEQKKDFIARLNVEFLAIKHNGYDGYKLLVPLKQAESTQELIDSEISKNLDYAYTQNKEDAKKIPLLVKTAMEKLPASLTQRQSLAKVWRNLTQVNWENPELTRLGTAINTLSELQSEANQPPVNKELLVGLVRPINELMTTHTLKRLKLNKDKKLAAETSSSDSLSPGTTK
ncbi:MAG TPA: hypothetical protein VHE99_06850 [Gammaproteobacteria bacterium]|nr:hypothetical protein [Gammaproteobacteria bacterium]